MRHVTDTEWSVYLEHANRALVSAWQVHTHTHTHSLPRMQTHTHTQTHTTRAHIEKHAHIFVRTLTQLHVRS